jgi:K+-transporting ATPase ATPase C chain
VSASGSPLKQYFQGRPSNATSGDAKDYGCDAGYSAAANLGPNSSSLTTTVKQLQKQVAVFDGVSLTQVPPDAVTSSASGLDPDISPAYAAIQVGRVASARDLPVATVHALVAKYTRGRDAWIFGEPAVDVLQLNLALDSLKQG